MMQITAANTANLPTSAKPAAPKGFAKKSEAQNAAVADIGPQARDGFEYQTSKVDGRWFWRSCDEVKPETEAQIKANGGKRAVVAPAKAKDTPKVVGPAIAAPLAETAQASPAGAPVAHPLDISPFLKREPETPDVKAKRIVTTKKASIPDRVLKNPPHVKQVTAKGRKTAGKQTKAALIGTLLLRKGGCTTADVLTATGWPAVSMPAQAKLVGLKLKKVKEGKASRYFGTPIKG